MGIRAEFGLRLKELRARSGMTQETLAFLAGLDRSYISGVERGERNISLVNIEKIASALRVSVAYLFANERFSVQPAYMDKDFSIPFAERFRYHLDSENRVLSFQIEGLLTGRDVEHMDSVLMGVCSAYRKGELKLLVDHREMKAADGQPAVYSPEVAERAIAFQQNLLKFTQQAVVLCNSEFMVHQLNHVTRESGIPSIHLYGNDEAMVGRAYELLGIHAHDLITSPRI